LWWPAKIFIASFPQPLTMAGMRPFQRERAEPGCRFRSTDWRQSFIAFTGARGILHDTAVFVQ